MIDFSVIIPARYNSSRLEAKLLRNINAKPLLQYTYENCINSTASSVIIATDDERIETVARGFGAQVCLTNSAHSSGTARLGEVIEKLSIDNDKIIVNVQADEPMLPAVVIQQVANNLANNAMPMATLCEPIADKTQYLDPNCVKVVFDKFGKALYFSRAPIPFFREGDFNPALCFKHIGIYAYRAGFIKKYVNMQDSKYQQIEKLEQLTALNEGFAVHIENACAPTGFGVDTAQDLEKVRQALNKPAIG